MAQTPRTTTNRTAKSEAPAPDPEIEQKAEDAVADTGTDDSGDTPEDETAAAKAAEKKEEPRQHQDYWTANAIALFGEEVGVVTAALVAAPRKNLTEDEVKGLISDYRGRAVEIDHISAEKE